MDENVKRIIIESEDGRKRDLINGTAIEIIDDGISLKSAGLAKDDLVKMAYGLLTLITQMGLDEQFKEFVDLMSEEDEYLEEDD